MYRKTIEMYADGYELMEIAEECLLNNEKDVIEDMAAFKELSKIARGKRFMFNSDFKDIIIRRAQSGFSLYSISQDLSISTSMVDKYLKEAGVEAAGKYKKPSKDYKVIENWDDFDCCPKCNRETTVRHLDYRSPEDKQNRKASHSFCSGCNTEWYSEKVGVKVIKEAAEDQPEVTEPIYEIREVLWFAVN